MSHLKQTDGYKQISRHISQIQDALALTTPEHPLDTQTTGSSKKLPVGKREILLVQNVTWLTSSYLLNSSDTTPRSSGYVVVSGQPSPNSTVTSGSIQFLPKAQLKRPSFSKSAIKLYIDIDFMPMTLHQLTQPKRYLWIGNFGNGHIYGDLHSTN